MSETNSPKKGNIVVVFLSEVRDELKQVTWPSRKTALNLTLIVIGVSVATGFYLGGLDFIFTQLMGLIL